MQSLGCSIDKLGHVTYGMSHYSSPGVLDEKEKAKHSILDSLSVPHLLYWLGEAAKFDYGSGWQLSPQHKACPGN